MLHLYVLTSRIADTVATIVILGARLPTSRSPNPQNRSMAGIRDKYSPPPPPSPFLLSPTLNLVTVHSSISKRLHHDVSAAKINRPSTTHAAWRKPLIHQLAALSSRKTGHSSESSLNLKRKCSGSQCLTPEQSPNPRWSRHLWERGARKKRRC